LLFLKKIAVMFIRYGLCMILAIMSNMVYAQIDIATGWRIKFDDNASYSSLTYDDKTWQPIAIGINWEKATEKEFDGIAWYRKKIVINGNLKKQALKRGFLELKLGKIDDADETYFNGTLVGKTGKFPPEKVSGYGTERLYKIPAHLIQWNKTNIIAIRVSDWAGGGGLYTGPYVFTVEDLATHIPITTENSNAMHYYEANTPFSIKNTVENKTDIKRKITVRYTITTFKDSMVYTKDRVLTLNPNQKVNETVMVKGLPIGFYKTNIALLVQGAIVNQFKHGFAVSPTLAKVQADMPTDFDAFWAAAKNELKTVAPNYTMLPQPGILDDAKFDVQLVEMKSLGNVLIRGWYVAPKGKKNIPGLLHVQGYSSDMRTQLYGNDHYASFFINIRGHGNSKDNINPGFPGFLTTGLEYKETYIYRGAYMDCIRALDFLSSRTEVDTSRLGVRGASQGGALSFITASLDNRIKCLASDVPFLSDFRNYFTLAYWPSNEFFEYAKNKGISMEPIYETLRYFDIKNHALRVNVPSLMAVGLHDNVCPPAINFAAYNNIATSNKQFALFPSSGHGVASEYEAVRMAWIYKQLGIVP
jgi:cephalosporin-C deacetylase